MKYVVASAVVAAFANAAAAQTPELARDDHPSAAAPRAIAAADFNRDGWIDIATAGTGRDGVAILLGGGRAGGVRALPERMLGGGPFDMAAGDLNRDGTPDLVVANADADAVDILIGRGDGTFAGGSRVGIGGGNPRGIALADFDRDGILDAIVTEYATGAWRVLYGDGAGGIGRQDRFGGIKNPHGVVAADFDHDGWIDVAIAGAGINVVAVFDRTPDGGIVQRNVLVGGAVTVLAAGDFNRDGWLDLAAVSSSNSAVYILRGAADRFTFASTVASGSSPRGLAVADVNQDRRLDLITANRGSSTINVHTGTGSGGFRSALTFAAGAGSRAVVAADLDRDGLADVASANEFGSTITVLTNETALAPAAFAFDLLNIGGFPTSCGSGDNRIAVADFNHNGRLDVVASADCGNVLSVRLDGTRTVTVDSEGHAGLPRTADLNRDGNPDVLTVDPRGVATTDLVAYLGDGRGAFTRVVGLGGLPGYGQAMRIGDVNRDGIADAVVLLWDLFGDSSTVRVLLGRGDGTFRAGAGVTVSEFPSEITLADIDGNTTLDVLVASFRGTFRLRGDGAGRYVREGDLPGAELAVVGDVNEDGRPDILLNRFPTALLLLGAGGGRFEDPIDVPDHSPVDLADMNADGHLDLLDIAVSQGISLGRGDGTWGRIGEFSPGLASGMAAVADYNADGLPDFIVEVWGEFLVMRNTRRTVNRAPVADAGPDAEMPYDANFTSEEPFGIIGRATDPDLHAIKYEWRNEQGDIVSNDQELEISGILPHGPHRYTLIVTDGRGGTDRDDVIITVVPSKEIVLYSWSGDYHGNWMLVEDPAAADGVRAHEPNAGRTKVVRALEDPPSYVDFTFLPDPTQTYKLWIRGRADGNSFANDSAHIQFTGAVDANGNPAWQIGTTSSLEFSLEECLNCGVSGWGWEDDGWGAANRNGVTIRFPDGGVQRIRIQTREDGLSIDQIVLSAERYLTERPGTAKNDTTILPRTQ